MLENTLIENVVKQQVFNSLSIGTIQPFQIEETLRMKGIPSFSLQRLQKEILESYEKTRPRY